jgi:Protein of unknown function (DUF2971)
LSYPDCLYKYTSASSTEIILKTGSLRWSSTSMFNDLNEFQRMPVFSPSLEDDWDVYLHYLVDVLYGDCKDDIKTFSDNTKLLLMLWGKIKRADQSKSEFFKEIYMPPTSDQARMSELLREFTEKSLNNDCARIYCLTEKYDNAAMWANYAEEHTGCVLGFKHIPHLSTPFIAAKPVSYTDGVPVIGRGLDLLLYGNTPELRKKTVEAIIYSKDISWSYEKEWRVVTWRPEETDKKYFDYEFYQQELDSLTFGPRADESKMSNISQVLSQCYPDCKVYKMTSNNGRNERTLI